MSKINSLIAEWRAMGPAAWAESPYGWITEEGKPIVLTQWQRATLEAWWIHRETISTLGISNVKKTGKTLLNGILLAWRFLCLPGQHFAAGNDLDQANSRAYSMVAEMVNRHPLLKKFVRVGRNEISMPETGSRLTALAVDASGNAGANHLTVSHTEAWGIIFESAMRSWEELAPPPGKTYGLPALRIADSYAGYDGQSTIWHKLIDRGLRGERVNEEWPIYKEGGLLLLHITSEEARSRCFRGTPEEAEAYYHEQAETLRPNAFRRQHENERTVGESQFLPDGAWEACLEEELKVRARDNKDRMVLGADASTSNDYTGLVGCVFNPKTGFIEVRFVKVWKPEYSNLRGKKTVDLNATIGAEVSRLKAAGLVDRVVGDPFQLHSLMMTWREQGVRVEELAQNSGRIESDQALYQAITTGTLKHYGDATLTEHIRNATAIETPRGMRLAKSTGRLKIDLAVCLSMAHYGALEQRAHPPGSFIIFGDDWD